MAEKTREEIIKELQERIGDIINKIHSASSAMKNIRKEMEEHGITFAEARTDEEKFKECEEGIRNLTYPGITI